MIEKVFRKNVSEPSKPSDELAQNVSKKKKKTLLDESFFFFSSKIQNLTVFSIIYMVRIRFFGPRELIWKEFRAAWHRVASKLWACGPPSKIRNGHLLDPLLRSKWALFLEV